MISVYAPSPPPGDTPTTSRLSFCSLTTTFAMSDTVFKLTRTVIRAIVSGDGLAAAVVRTAAADAFLLRHNLPRRDTRQAPHGPHKPRRHGKSAATCRRRHPSDRATYALSFRNNEQGTCHARSLNLPYGQVIDNIRHTLGFPGQCQGALPLLLGVDRASQRHGRATGGDIDLASLD